MQLNQGDGGLNCPGPPNCGFGCKYLLSARAYKIIFVLENERYKHNQATDIYFFKICKADIRRFVIQYVIKKLCWKEN